MKIGKKGKTILAVCLSLVALLGVGVLASGDFLSFDTRSRAEEGEMMPELPMQFQKADLNGDGIVSMEDYRLWAEAHRNYRSDNSAYLEIADLNSDGRITLEDVRAWLNIWREYKTYERNVPAKVPVTVPPDQASEDVPDTVPVREVPAQVPSTVPVGGR